ncbi:MAG: phosphoribosylglycinamide formyltransferase [Magnetococcales bacterium]|nr:phosphoribosylglycinamide formyltransferase [Magnetococcales bacterium]
MRIGVLVSGGGTNLQALIDCCQLAESQAEIVLVLSNRADAFGLQRAEKNGIENQVIDHRRFDGRESFDLAMIRALDAARVDLVCLAGFMRLLTPAFVQHYAQRLINIHPALLPAFPGLHVQQRAIEAGVRFSGATVHFVDEGMDTGPVIIQAVVPILADDDEDRLSARILKQEHQIYPQAVRWFSENRISIREGRVVIDGCDAQASAALINPPIS